jgi:hypothetical protein
LGNARAGFLQRNSPSSSRRTPREETDMTPTLIETINYLLDGPFVPFAVLCVVTLVACDWIETKGRSK